MLLVSKQYSAHRSRLLVIVSAERGKHLCTLGNAVKGT